MSRYKQYDVLKHSNIAWLGQIPENWQLKRFKNIFKIQKRISGELGYQILSITQRGIKVKDIESGDGQLSMDYSKYQLVYKNDFAMNHMDLLTGFVDISNFDGVTSPDYRVFTMFEKNSHDRYFLYLLQLCYIAKIFYPLGQGAATVGRWRLPTEAFTEFLAPLPNLQEQKAIANFLDHETAKIDTLIAKQQELIKLLKEKRQAVISHAVTKGLNPNAPMRDSGVEWLGEVPAHWDTKKLKYLCDLQTGDKNTEDAIDEGIYPFFVRSQTVERLNTFTADCEAVLTAGDGAGVGKVFHYFVGKFDFHQRVYMMNKFRFVIGKFFFHYLENMFHKVALDGGAKSTVDSLRMPLFLNFQFTVPPRSEQLEIIKFIEKNNDLFNRLTMEASKAISLMQERRTALISAAVTGKIDVRDWQPPSEAAFAA